MIFQEAPGSDQGLTIWSAFVLSPEQNIAKLPFQVNGGLVYKGLIPTRHDDYICFAVVYGKFSRNYARTGEGYPDYELVFESRSSSPTSNGSSIQEEPAVFPTPSFWAPRRGILAAKGRIGPQRQ
jgi:hypothetical protein